MDLADIASILALVGGILFLAIGGLFLLFALSVIISYLHPYFHWYPEYLDFLSILELIYPVVVLFIIGILILAVRPFIRRNPIGAGVALIILGLLGFFLTMGFPRISGILAFIVGVLALLYGLEQWEKA